MSLNPLWNRTTLWADPPDAHAHGRGPGEGPPSQSKSSYAEELKQQMQLKKDRLAREKRVCVLQSLTRFVIFANTVY